MTFLALTSIFQCDFFPEHHRNWHGSWCTHLCVYLGSFSPSVSCSVHTRTITVVWNHPCTPAIFCYWGSSIGPTSYGPTRWDRSCSWYSASLWLWCWSISSWQFWWRFMLRYVPSFPCWFLCVIVAITTFKWVWPSVCNSVTLFYKFVKYTLVKLCKSHRNTYLKLGQVKCALINTFLYKKSMLT